MKNNKILETVTNDSFTWAKKDNSKSQTLNLSFAKVKKKCLKELNLYFLKTKTQQR